MTQHADLEALSAFVDGEAPEWAGHIETCATCRASADQLRAVSSAVRAPVEPPDPRVRDAAIAAALGDVVRPHATERVPAGRRRVNWQLALAAAAAVIFGVAGLATLLATQTPSRDESTTVAGPALHSVPDAGKAGSAESSSAADAAAPPVADLGDVPDAATLLARARPAGATAGAPSSAASPTTASGARSAVPSAPAVTGTRPCEEQARSREPALGQVVYFATARRGSVPAYVLGFSTGPSGTPVTLLLLAQNGCGELLRAAGP